MSLTESRPPVSPGEPAPDFTLPAVDREATISLADYRHQKPLFLALFIGLWCPFCRRSIAQLGATESKLRALGVETLAVVATAPENARLYFKFLHAMETTRINPNGTFPEPLPIMEAAATVAKLDGYAENPTDRSDMERQWPQLKGQFLIDRNGIVRWANIECATEGMAGVGKFPSAEEIIAAVHALP
jgi:alkyl hydroperoxide reductase subunit AhpC